MNYLKALRRKFRKQRDKFIAEYEFKTAGELTFTVEEIADAVELKRIIYVEFGGKKRFPVFQFDERGQVYPSLQKHLPRLLDCRSGWDICFWLTRETGVTLKRLKPDACMLVNITIDEALAIAKKAEELTEICIAKPIDLAIAGDNETFTAFVEDWLAPDRRDIPEPTVPENFWESFFDEQSSKPDTQD